MNQGFLLIINFLTSLAGLIGIFGVFIYLGRKLEKLDRLEHTVEILKDNVKVIADHLSNKSDGFNASDLKNYSPTQLTDGGKKFIEEVGFDNVFAEHKQDFFDFIEREKPKLKYDIERESIQSIWHLSDKDYMKFLKVYMYNNPDRSMKNTAPTLGVYVRDAYLAEHPEITE